MSHRMLRDSILTSATIDRLSVDAERFFYRLIVVADDCGRFNADPRLLKSHCFPRHDDGRTSPARVAEWLADLEAADLIRRYQVGAEVYGFFPTWTKHQRLRRVRPSSVPDPADACRTSAGGFPQPAGEPRTSAGGFPPEVEVEVEGKKNKIKTLDHRTAETAVGDRVGSGESPESAHKGNPNPSEGPDKGKAKNAAPARSGPAETGRLVEVDTAFGRFWTAYPRKVGKGQAAKAFRSAAAKVPAGDLEAWTDRLIAAITRCRKTRQWAESIADRSDPCGKVPHPATWLNGRRWEDEHPAPGPAPRRLGERDPEAEAADDPAYNVRLEAAREWEQVIRAGQKRNAPPIPTAVLEALDRARLIGKVITNFNDPEYAKARDEQRRRFIEAYVEVRNGMAPVLIVPQEATS